ncbi:hypothetical protein ACTOJ1_006123 [Shigella flexneri]
MSILHFENEEERIRFIEDLSNHLSISINCETNYDCYSDREYSNISVSLYFDEHLISNDIGSF